VAGTEEEGRAEEGRGRSENDGLSEGPLPTLITEEEPVCGNLLIFCRLACSLFTRRSRNSPPA